MTSDDKLMSVLATQETAPDSIERAVLIRTALADQYTPMAGPVGPLFVGFTPRGVSSIVPTSDEEEFLAEHSRRVGRRAFPGSMPVRLAGQLQRTLDTGRIGKLPVDLRQLTDFQRQVLEIAATIPPGEVRPYAWVAREMGSERAVRAVGSALGRNPVPIAIPCHRVVRSDGAIGNYAFGSQMKRSLLQYEGMTEFEAMRFVGSDTNRVYCYSTCRHARRIAEKHRVEFATPARAEAAGYRSCKVCRPA